MQYLKYLNYPEIPEELLHTPEEIVNLPTEEMVVRDFPAFYYKPVKPKLDAWLRTIFKFNFYVKYQVIQKGIPIHFDKPAFKGDRRVAYNYLLQLGGNNVITSVYDKDLNVLESECLPLKRWHSLRVEMLHGVDGIEELNNRVAVTVTPLLG